MKKRLFLYTLLLTALVILVFVTLSAIAADIWYSRILTSDLASGARLVSSLAEQMPQEDYHALAESAARDLSMDNKAIRVTIIAPDGKVLGDSEADWKSMESHSDRPEVVAALKNGVGSSQRYSATLKVRMLYVACYQPSSKVVVRAAVPMVEIYTVYKVLGLFFGFSMLLSLLIAALIARRMSRSITKPLEALAATTDSIARGNYHIDSIPIDDKEFSSLSQGLIQLAHDLDTHVSALENSNTRLTSVLSSITEGLIAIDGEGKLLFINEVGRGMLELGNPSQLIGQKVTSAIPVKSVNDLFLECLRQGKTISTEILLSTEPPMLLQATASPMHAPAYGCLVLLVNITQIRKLENMRRDFVANVTHELRTPLTSIRGYVETLQSGALANKELAEKFLQIIEIESERLSNLISDLLYLSEIENSNQDTGIRPFRLADVANSVAEMLEYTAFARNISVRCTIDDAVVLEANPDRIKQLLLNLADNAVKYNQDGGSVLISAEKTAGLVRISVKDTGIGISEEHINRIFERFYRVDKGRSRSMGGTGLGLSIVKHIVDLYRGNIRLTSESGKGSEFVIELPLKYEVKKKS